MVAFGAAFHRHAARFSLGPQLGQFSVQLEKAKVEQGREDIRKEGGTPVCGYTNPGGSAVMQQADVQSVLYSNFQYQRINAVLVQPAVVFDTAQIGTRVQVRWLPKGKKKEEITPEDEVGCEEDDVLLGSSYIYRPDGISDGWVSHGSPIGESLLGKKVGDLTFYRVEQEVQALRILKIGPVNLADPAATQSLS